RRAAARRRGRRRDPGPPPARRAAAGPLGQHRGRRRGDHGRPRPAGVADAAGPSRRRRGAWGGGARPPPRPQHRSRRGQRHPPRQPRRGRAEPLRGTRRAGRDEPGCRPGPALERDRGRRAPATRRRSPRRGLDRTPAGRCAVSLLAVALVLAAVLCWPGRGATSGVPRSRLALGRWRRRGSPLEDLESLARVADLLAMTLRSGATPVTAVAVVTEQASSPWAGVLGEVHGQLAAGAPVGEVWQRHARERPELSALAGAWALSEDLGVALAPSMATSAQVLRAQVQGQRRLDASTSGAR